LAYAKPSEFIFLPWYTVLTRIRALAAIVFDDLNDYCSENNVCFGVHFFPTKDIGVKTILASHTYSDHVTLHNGMDYREKTKMTDQLEI